MATAPLTGPASAQTSEAVGVVTTLDGRATVARPALTAPLALKFKDDVFGRDRISTQEHSLVRVLMGGKAILTVRELSEVTISEEPGRAVVTLPSGKVVLAVAKQRMRPGESIEIRTPNAVAAVRGSILAVAYDAAQNLTTAICHSGNCTYQFQGGPTNPLPPGQGAKNGTVAAVSDAERNEAVNVDTSRHAVNGPDPAFQASLLQAEAGKAALVANFAATGVVPAVLGQAPTQVVQSPSQAPLNGFTENPPSGGNPPTGSLPGIITPPGGNPGGGGSESGNGGGSGNFGQISNGGFENGLASWTLSGAGAALGSLGPTTPPSGSGMGMIYTGGAAVNDTTSTLSQTFNVTGGKLYIVQASVSFYSDEHPNQSSIFNDTWTISTRSPGQTGTTLLKQEARNDVFTLGNTTLNTSTVPASGGGFVTNGPSPYGITGFRDFSLQWTPTASGTGELLFSIFDVGDSSVDSAILIDNVAVLEDPPLYFLRAGDTLSRATSEPLLSLTGTPMTFDTLLAVGAGGRATLAGPLLRAVDSDLTVPFSLVSLFQGGTLTTSSTDPLAFLSGGRHSFGSVGVAMFDLSGVNTATDPDTGLRVGSDRPLQHGGPLLETSNAAVNTQQAVRVDTALLEATAPLLALRDGSTLTTRADAVALSYQAKVTSLGSMVKLDRSAMVVANGAALSLAGGSLARVTGDLFSLTNGSSLSVLNGALVSLSGGSMLNVNGSLIGFGGTGGNLVSVANNLCPCTTIGGLPVSLTNGALASNINIAGAIKNSNLGSLTIAPNAAVIRVDGAGTKVTINGL
ncbi:MAG TPA: FecR domain-containing protein [Methylomirabilota bacterium]